MKFGAQLQDAILPEWQAYYLDYDLLKKKLRKAENEQAFTERDETEFVEMLDSNLEKVKTKGLSHFVLTKRSKISNFLYKIT